MCNILEDNKRVFSMNQKYSKPIFSDSLWGKPPENHLCDVGAAFQTKMTQLLPCGNTHNLNRFSTHVSQSYSWCWWWCDMGVRAHWRHLVLCALCTQVRARMAQLFFFNMSQQKILCAFSVHIL